MNRKQQRAEVKRSRQALTEHRARLSDAFRDVPREEWRIENPKLIRVFESRKYLVQVYAERQNLLRLSVCRTELDSNGHWRDGLSWDELQQIKRDIGMGEEYAVEVYPPDADVVNVANNMRHLWVMQFPIPGVGWRGSHVDQS